jgi:hypothetical protein
MASLSRLLRKLGIDKFTRPRAAPTRRRVRLAFDPLEERCVLSTTSAITANFNGSAIPAGDTLWFSSAVTVSGLPNAPVTLHVENGSINFTAGGTASRVPVPNAVIVFTPGTTSASTQYDPSDNDYDTSVPPGGTGSVFMTGVALPLPNGLPGNVKNVTWTGDFWSDTANISVNWKWAAAAYQTLGTDNNALGIKPVDNNKLSIYLNGDKAGTPEAFKAAVVAGGMGSGGNNYTGNFTGNAGVKPSLGDGLGVYPFVSSNPLTSIAFNESTVLRAAKLDTVNGTFDLWYSDEHAMALGIRQVNVITASSTTTTNYAVSPLGSNPGSALSPAIGATATSGDQAGTDASGRPMTPMLYITDITTDPNNLSGDWQYGGTGYAPSAVFGTWKAFTRTVNHTTSPAAVTLTADADPAQNQWNLGTGADAPPAGLSNEGYGTEVRWDLNALYNQGVLQAGHSYRFYVMVHDGDQNKAGGDAGQAAYVYTLPAPPPQTATISGTVFADANMNAVQDPGEVGLPNVQITITGYDLNNNFVQLSVPTDANGFYKITVAPGLSYTLTEQDLRPVYLHGTDSVGTDNGTKDGAFFGNGSMGRIALNAGDNAIFYNFAEIGGGG